MPRDVRGHLKFLELARNRSSQQRIATVASYNPDKTYYCRLVDTGELVRCQNGNPTRSWAPGQPVVLSQVEGSGHHMGVGFVILTETPPSMGRTSYSSSPGQTVWGVIGQSKLTIAPVNQTVKQGEPFLITITGALPGSQPVALSYGAVGAPGVYTGLETVFSSREILIVHPPTATVGIGTSTMRAVVASYCDPGTYDLTIGTQTFPGAITVAAGDVAFPEVPSIEAQWDFNKLLLETSGNYRWKDWILTTGGDLVESQDAQTYPTSWGEGIRPSSIATDWPLYYGHESRLQHPFTIELLLRIDTSLSTAKLALVGQNDQSGFGSVDSGWWMDGTNLKVAYGNALQETLGAFSHGARHYVVLRSISNTKVECFIDNVKTTPSGGVPMGLVIPSSQRLYFIGQKSSVSDSSYLDALRISLVGRTDTEIAAAWTRIQTRP